MAHPTIQTDVPNNPHCTLCQEEDAQNVAVTWCIDCETFLCSSCNKFHGRSRASKDHHAISIENYISLPTFITKTKTLCQEHGKRLDAYCSDHQVACCLDCIISDHKSCKEIQKIEDVVKGYKSSSSVFHIERNLCDLLKNYELIEKFLIERMSAIDTQKRTGKTEIKSMKQKIITHLGLIERKLLDELESSHSEMKLNIEGLKSEIETRKSKLGYLSAGLEKMKEFATELQMFEGIKEIEKVSTEEMKYIENCQKTNLLDELIFEVKFSNKLKSITTDIESFGKVSFLNTRRSLELKFGSGQQVITDTPIIPQIDEIKPTIKKTFAVSTNIFSEVTGCQILPDARMLFVDLGRKILLLFSKEGNYVRDVVSFPLKPYDIVYVKDNVVAVSSFKDAIVYLVDIESNRIIKSTNVGTPCYGIGLDDSKSSIRLTTGNARTIINLDLDGKVKSRQTLASCALRIATFKDNIYLSEYRDNRISCYSKEGECLWASELGSGSYPCGVSVDKHGFLYVACLLNNNVIVLSADGNRRAIICKQTDGLSSPAALSIDRKASTLLVVNNTGGLAFLFQLY